MDTRVLEYFVLAADLGSVTKAAALLHVSQPTVSRQLMELEGELGKTLLNRGRQGLTLTEDGLRFRETAREMLALYRKATEDAASLAGEIHLGTGETESFTWLAQQIADFQRDNPAVRFHITSENAERIREDIDKGLLDLGFVHRRVNPAQYEALELSFWERWGALVPEGHPLSGKEALSPADLASERLLLPENALFQSELLHWFGPDAERRVAATCNLGHNAAVLTRAGLALAVCFGSRMPRGDGLVFVPLAGMEEAPALLIWKRKPVLPQAVERFLSALKHTENA